MTQVAGVQSVTGSGSGQQRAMRIGSSLLLVAIGAILLWAVDVTDSTYGDVTVDWSVVGAIILIAGLGGLVWAWYLTSEWHERMSADRDAARRAVSAPRGPSWPGSDPGGQPHHGERGQQRQG